MCSQMCVSPAIKTEFGREYKLNGYYMTKYKMAPNMKVTPHFSNLKCRRNSKMPM